jgi:hypothetical protein
VSSLCTSTILAFCHFSCYRPLLRLQLYLVQMSSNTFSIRKTQLHLPMRSRITCDGSVTYNTSLWEKMVNGTTDPHARRQRATPAWKGTFDHREGAFDHQGGATDLKEGGSHHKEGAPNHQEGVANHQEGAPDHQAGAFNHQEGAFNHKQDALDHRAGGGRKTTRPLGIVFN